MNKVNFTFILSGIVALGTVVNYGIYQQNQMSYLKNELELSEQRNNINEDQLNEIMFSQLDKMTRNDLEIAKNQGISEGILLTFKKPEEKDQFENIWHDGYYQGLDQNRFIAKNSYTEGYHLGIDHALQDSGISHPSYDANLIPKQKMVEVTEEESKELVKFKAKVRTGNNEDFDRKIKEYIRDQEEKGDPEKK